MSSRASAPLLVPHRWQHAPAQGKPGLAVLCCSTRRSIARLLLSISVPRHCCYLSVWHFRHIPQQVSLAPLL